MAFVGHSTTMGERHRAYSCFGLRIRSALPLPEIANAAAFADDCGPAAIDFKFGSVCDDLPGTPNPGQSLQVGNGDVLLKVKDTARYLIRGGREITIDPVPGSSERNVRLFLLGSAFGILCYQRGLLPLHANAVVVNGEAIAFAGHSGAGKSTLAAHFQRIGYQVLCDDVCVLSFDSVGRPLAWPGLPRLKLWRDAVESFGHDCNLLEPAIEGMEKYHVPFARDSRQGPFPFRRLYVLKPAEPGTANRITPLTGAAAYGEILSQTYRRQYLNPLGLMPRHLEQGMAILKHTAIYRAPRSWGYDVFAQEAEKLERHVLEASA